MKRAAPNVKPMTDRLPSLFSGGTGRSGTTSVVNLLSRHSLVHTSLPREIRFLTDPYGLLDLTTPGRRIFYSRSWKGKAADLKKFLVRADAEDIFAERMRTMWFENTGKGGKPRGLVQSMTLIQLDAELAPFADHFKSSPLQASQDLYLRLAALQIENAGKVTSEYRYFADSTPINILHAKRINDFLPGSKFVNMVRDGRDVAFSVMKEHWGPSDPFDALAWWSRRMADGFSALKAIPADQQMTLRLEDLIINNREGSYAKLLAFLDLADEAKIHDYFNQSLVAEKMTQGSWSKSDINLAKFEKKYETELKRLADIGCVIERLY